MALVAVIVPALVTLVVPCPLTTVPPALIAPLLVTLRVDGAWELLTPVPAPLVALTVPLLTTVMLRPARIAKEPCEVTVTPEATFTARSEFTVLEPIAAKPVPLLILALALTVLVPPTTPVPWNTTTELGRVELPIAAPTVTVLLWPVRAAFTWMPTLPPLIVPPAVVITLVMPLFDEALMPMPAMLVLIAEPELTMTRAPALLAVALIPVPLARVLIEPPVVVTMAPAAEIAEMPVAKPEMTGAFSDRFTVEPLELA